MSTPKIYVEPRELISIMGVPFKELSQGFVIKCINPNHDDTNPSGRIYLDSGAFHCFSCGYHLSNFELAKEYNCLPAYKKDSDKELKLRPKKVFLPVEKEVGDYCFLPKGFTQLKEEFPPLNLSMDMIKTFNVGECSIGVESRNITTECDGCAYKKQWLWSDGTCGFAFNRTMIPITKGDELCSLEARVRVKRESVKKILYPTGSKLGKTIFNYSNLDRKAPLYLVEGIKGALRVYKDISTNVTAIFSNLIKSNQKDLLLEFSHIIIIPDLGDAGSVTVKALYDIGVKKLEVVELPSTYFCTMCGKERVSSTCACGNTEYEYGDVFDVSLEALKTAIQNRKAYSASKYMMTKTYTKKEKLELRKGK